ncbi:hypothetical protein SERLA73DRAFT_68470 [Serpula lacrymans var. lacrymans S7.3]|uniref:Uncharacterized protein n=2 Tax=Serpula lacrymans var. lacrymans TaxID=341189 RepID=F8PG97_SERL3|nr:uncharacterized protein SERLADRAFT_432225 [Serpula lacrymans var. lacrymans S7.9]EGO04804.1 hypothetical protein SERLA73DRAFT_68470 [Serpula lacrymans var. lacrymans S7.3]EGO30637.1 hypothetical protein SERLADRAFT_432225 [Serpula lacrymans var. lacrymans S7.9]
MSLDATTSPDPAIQTTNKVAQRDIKDIVEAKIVNNGLNKSTADKVTAYHF